jgi:hypothetical protein
MRDLRRALTNRASPCSKRKSVGRFKANAVSNTIEQAIEGSGGPRQTAGAAMAEIYALYSGRDGKVRYVGQTFGTRDVRFKEHQRSQIERDITAVYTWIHDEWKAGYPVQCALLERCSNEGRLRLDLETEWISKFPNLLNERKRGYYWHRRKPPVIPEIRDYMARFVFNSGGFRGNHWWRELDRYSVFIYTGGDWEWLPGDGAPGWTGDIWFSDRTQALKAREKYRQGRYCNWHPDIEQEMVW